VYAKRVNKIAKDTEMPDGFDIILKLFHYLIFRNVKSKM